MTEPKKPDQGGDGDTAARPSLVDKAKEVLARGAGAESAVESTEKIAPVADGGPGAKKPAQKPVVKPVVKPAADDVESTRTSLSARSSVDEPTQAMPKVAAPMKKAAPVAATPPAPSTQQRPLFADGPRAEAPAAARPPQPATATQVTPAVAAAAPAAAAAPPKARPAAARKARLRLVKVDPWSVMKTSFLLSLAFGVVLFVAVMMIWLVLGAAGVWDSVNEAVKNFDETSTFDVTQYLGAGRILGLTALVAVVDVVLMTALATLTAFLYNMSASLLGGVELTFAEERN